MLRTCISNVSKKGKVIATVMRHDIEDALGNGDKTPSNLNLDTRWKVVVSFSDLEPEDVNKTSNVLLLNYFCVNNNLFP